MRKTISSTLAVLAITAAALVGTGSPAAAASCEGVSVHSGSGEGALAFCLSGEGDIRVVIHCLREADFKKYTKFGVWRHDRPHSETYSSAYCNGADALRSHTFQVA
ncbi:hypothetical protein FHR83_009135 [Actinoplanes campanulatus]|uniref:Beta/Gamma crystallin n=1 Tax=Actinoplanes campanulatus TaxID=113559 RepID=A0A7W5AS86_9ACTN|nr:hypothetical protein [Actinoplanes campanulatus]MBB3101406.1 hypothetical protein [Actinoplanes campanulatus]